MSFFLAIFLALTAPLQTSDLNGLIDGVDRTFGRMRDFSADFIQNFEDPLNRKQEESGHLYLMKARMMRIEYKNPEEKLFVSDGKTVYLYVPAERQVSREAVGKALDDRIPMMFLLGQTGLRDKFARFELLSTRPFLTGDKVLRMVPKGNTDISEVMVEVDPVGYLIRRLVLVSSDQSRNEFIFSNIRTNTGLQSSLFNFKAPAGVEVVEGLGQ